MVDDSLFSCYLLHKQVLDIEHSKSICWFVLAIAFPPLPGLIVLSLWERPLSLQKLSFLIFLDPKEEV